MTMARRGLALLALLLALNCQAVVQASGKRGDDSHDDDGPRSGGGYGGHYYSSPVYTPTPSPYVPTPSPVATPMGPKCGDNYYCAYGQQCCYDSYGKPKCAYTCEVPKSSPVPSPVATPVGPKCGYIYCAYGQQCCYYPYGKTKCAYTCEAPKPSPAPSPVSLPNNCGRKNCGAYEKCCPGKYCCAYDYTCCGDTCCNKYTQCKISYIHKYGYTYAKGYCAPIVSVPKCGKVYCGPKEKCCRDKYGNATCCSKYASCCADKCCGSKETCYVTYKYYKWWKGKKAYGKCVKKVTVKPPKYHY